MWVGPGSAMGVLAFLCGLWVGLTAGAAPLDAQIRSSLSGASAPSVFLDCQGRMPCNRQHFRTELRFVNWARDRADSDVHVIVTSEDVGGGGRRFTFDFIGLGEMAALTDQLTYTSQGSDVSAETLDGMTRTLRLGLLRYAVEGGLGNDFDVRFTGAVDEAEPEQPDESGASAQGGAYDPWNYWTFRAGLSGQLDLRESRTQTEVNPSLNADRVTENWKFNFRGRLDFRREGRELSDGTVVRDDRDDWSSEILIVRSVGGNLSVGVETRARNSITDNQNARIELAPAVEYNYFPYVEATRRQLIAQYSFGLEHSNYREETVYGVEVETLPQHRIAVQYNAREQWGNAGMGVDFSQYIHDTGLYSMGIGGNVNYRILRGLDLNLFGRASWVKDEIHTPASSISDEDILLGRQRLPSAYDYRASVGFSYRWGSSFTNVVNTRFSQGVF